MTANATIVMRGRLQVMFAGFLFAFGSVFIRMIEEASSWHIVAWRGVFLAIFMFVYLIYKRRDSVRGSIQDSIQGSIQDSVLDIFREAGLHSLLAGLALSSAFIFFVFALTHTTAAQALLMLSLASFFAAILARIFIGEHPSRTTWVCMIIAVFGVMIMVQSGLQDGTMIGAFYGLMAALSYAIYSVTLRVGRAKDMTPSVCAAGVITAIVGFSILGFSGISILIPAYDLVLCSGMGFIHLGLGLLILLAGSKHVMAAEIPLLTLTEVVFGPLLVWLMVNEIPNDATLIGGAVLLVAVVGNGLGGRMKRQTA